MSPITSSLTAESAADVLSFLAALEEPEASAPAWTPRVIKGGLGAVAAEQVAVSAGPDATVTASERTIAHTGSKYESGRDVADVAKLVRADLKTFLAKNPAYKGTKVSVTIQRSSMSSALNLRVTALPFSAYTEAELRSIVNHGSAKYRTELGLLLDELERICEAYQKSSSGTDYCHSNFHVSVGVCSDLTNGELATYRALRAHA